MSFQVEEFLHIFEMATRAESSQYLHMHLMMPADIWLENVNKNTLPGRFLGHVVLLVSQWESYTLA